jgi:RimJ/RimL family protein N-acetyltransferase
VTAGAWPVGVPVPGWVARPRPAHRALFGQTCRLEPLDAGQHAADLFNANGLDASGRMWTYLPVGPFADAEAYSAWIDGASRSEDPLFFAIIDAVSGRAVGVASYLRIDPANGVIEVGHLQFSRRLQRTPAATEAIFLLMKHAFDALGYRRFEWKCDSLNAPSRAAAERLGFTYEGTFRQAVVYKGRNRDTAWYAIVDGDWPTIRAAFEAWLSPSNFDASGQQRARLADLRAGLGGLPKDFGSK